jgi:hypothetical protein
MLRTSFRPYAAFLIHQYFLIFKKLQLESGIYSPSFDTDIDIQDEYFTQVRQLK